MIAIYKISKNNFNLFYILPSKFIFQNYTALLVNSKITIYYNLMFQYSKPEYCYLDNQKDIFNK